MRVCVERGTDFVHQTQWAFLRRRHARVATECAETREREQNRVSDMSLRKNFSVMLFSGSRYLCDLLLLAFFLLCRSVPKERRLRVGANGDGDDWREEGGERNGDAKRGKQ